MVNFVKMHGLGNHFVFFDASEDGVNALATATAARRICDVRRGIGADGVVFIRPPDDPRHHARMAIFNADGSEAEMCGNAIRCVAHWLRQRRPLTEQLTIETGAGLKTVHPAPDSGQGEADYRVGMGRPADDLETRGELLPANARRPLAPAGTPLPAPVYVSMGNPHLVLFSGVQWPLAEVRRLGPWLENHGNHPRRINVEFVTIIDRHHVRMQVWERGCGITAACGTGACATAAAGIRTERLASPVEVTMPGGRLSIAVDDGGELWMTGPVETVAHGTFTRRAVAQWQRDDEGEECAWQS